MPTKKAVPAGTAHEAQKLLSDGDIFVEIYILNGVEKLGTFGHRTLEGFAAADEAHTASALVDNSSLNSLSNVVLARSAARVNKSGSAHVAVGYLITGEIDRIVSGEL